IEEILEVLFPLPSSQLNLSVNFHQAGPGWAPWAKEQPTKALPGEPPLPGLAPGQGPSGTPPGRSCLWLTHDSTTLRGHRWQYLWSGVVVPIFKKGDQRVCSNYRGVLERRVR
ncbi:hypothetical protein L3Q82_019331, partial [Scortum barcoo]